MDIIKLGIGFGGWRLGTPSAATVFELIDKSESWGIDSIWLSDHIIDVGANPELDTPSMLAAIAARTTRMKMGPSVLSLPLRHPVVTAKTFATLDYLAPGRVICAVGLGSNPKEFGALGMTIEHRAVRVRDVIRRTARAGKLAQAMMNPSQREDTSIFGSVAAPTLP